MTTLTISVLLCAASICTGALSLLLTRHLNRLTDQLSGVNVRRPFDVNRAAARFTRMRRTRRGHRALLGVMIANVLLNVAVAFWPAALELR